MHLLVGRACYKYIMTRHSVFMNDGVNILTIIVNIVESELPQILLHGSCAKIRIED